MFALRIIIAVIMCVLSSAPSTYAQDANEWIGQAFRQLDRNRRQRRTGFEQQVEQLLLGCQQQNVAACDAILNLPNLNPQARTAILQMRQAAAAAQQGQYDQFRANWQSCAQTYNVTACNAALAFPNLGLEDRARVLGWRSIGLQQQEREQAERQEQSERAERQRIEAGRQQLEAIRDQVRMREADERQAEMARRRTERAEREHRILAGKAQREQDQFMLWGAIAAGVLVLGLVSFGIRRTVQHRPPGTPVTPPEFARHPPATAHARPSSVPTVVSEAPLTGHFPTDVRRALAS